MVRHAITSRMRACTLDKKLVALEHGENVQVADILPTIINRYKRLQENDLPIAKSTRPDIQRHREVCKCKVQRGTGEAILELTIKDAMVYQGPGARVWLSESWIGGRNE